MRHLLDTMALHPGFQRTSSKPAAIEFNNLLHHCDANDEQYDDDDNNDLQWGHFQFSGHWQDACASWDVIGTTTMARDFLVGAIKVVTTARYVSHKRGIPHHQLNNLLAKFYFAQLVDGIASAWENAGGVSNIYFRAPIIHILILLSSPSWMALLMELLIPRHRSDRARKHRWPPMLHPNPLQFLTEVQTRAM